MPPTRHSLGEPLPHQLADRPQTIPFPTCVFTVALSGWDHRELACLSAGYAREKGMYLRVTNPFATGSLRSPFDLHALSTPPAFILS